MSILSDAWRRSRGEHDEVSRALGAPPVHGGAGSRHVLPWVLCGVLVVVLAGLGVYVWRVTAVGGKAPATPRAVVRHADTSAKAAAAVPATFRAVRGGRTPSVPTLRTALVIHLPRIENLLGALRCHRRVDRVRIVP